MNLDLLLIHHLRKLNCPLQLTQDFCLGTDIPVNLASVGQSQSLSYVYACVKEIDVQTASIKATTEAAFSKVWLQKGVQGCFIT